MMDSLETNSPIHQNNDVDKKESTARLIILNSDNKNDVAMKKIDNANEGKEAWEETYYRPLSVFFRAFLIAWIYVMMPCDNYWIYFMVKYQYWCAFTLASFVELFAAILPDVADSIYIASYVFGFLVAPFARLLSYIYGMAEYNLLNNVAVLLSYLTICIFYSIDTFKDPFTKDQLMRQQRELAKRSDKLDSNTLADNGSLPISLSTINTGKDSQPASSPFQMDLFLSMFIAIGRSPTPLPVVTLTRTDSLNVTTVSGKDIGDVELLPTSTTTSSDQQTSQVLKNENISKSEALLRLISANIIFGLDQIFVAKFFFFLPRFWLPITPGCNQVHPWINRRVLMAQISLFVLVYMTDYLFLIYFTIYFRTAVVTSLQRIGLFMIYIGVNTVYRTIVKSFGMFLDKRKPPTVSMFFVGEVMGLFFYYTFYRVLFESIRSVPEFIGFQVFHLASEWLLYVLRCTETYYIFTERMIVKYAPKMFQSLYRMTHKDWQQFIALDFGIRCAVFVTTGYGAIIMFLTIQYVPWVAKVNGLHEDRVSFTYTSMFIVTAVILELINAWAMNKFFFRRLGLDVQYETQRCFSLPHFSLLALLVACNLCINPMYAFTTVDYQDQSHS